MSNTNALTLESCQRQRIITDRRGRPSCRIIFGIPDGFGFVGAPGAYDDNDGAYRIRIGVNEVPTMPEPATAALLCLALAAYGWRRRAILTSSTRAARGSRRRIWASIILAGDSRAVVDRRGWRCLHNRRSHWAAAPASQPAAAPQSCPGPECGYPWPDVTERANEYAVRAGRKPINPRRARQCK